MLASKLAAELRADLLVVLTDINALYKAVGDAENERVERVPTYSPGVSLVRSGIPFDTGKQSLGDQHRGAFEGRSACPPYEATEEADQYLSLDGGVQLLHRLVRPKGKQSIRCSVLMLHGLGTHSERLMQVDDGFTRVSSE